MHRWVYWTFIVYYCMDLWNPKRLVHHALVQYAIKGTSGWLYRTEIVKKRDSTSWIKTFIEKKKPSIAGAPIAKDSNQNSRAQLYQLLNCIFSLFSWHPSSFPSPDHTKPCTFPHSSAVLPFYIPEVMVSFLWDAFSTHPHPTSPSPSHPPAKSHSRFTFSKNHSSTSCSQPHF